MNKEISMSIHDFMRVQRNEITYKDLDDSESSALDEFLSGPFSMEQMDKIMSVATVAVIASVTTVKVIELILPPIPIETVACIANQQVDGDLLKEGIEVIYSATSNVLQYAYKLMKAMMSNM